MEDYEGTGKSKELFEGKYFYQCEWHGLDSNGNPEFISKEYMEPTVDDIVQKVYDHESLSWLKNNHSANVIYNCLNIPQTKLLREVQTYHNLLQQKNNHTAQITQYLEIKELIQQDVEHMRKVITKNEQFV